ncbi:tetratricopeptide repeat protein 27 isoform X2 [Macrosteles quadrilineatus]|uniref:tetratricopeptide repeat protein 27 isoform X2 n=1 Tax=Macrosteles quadrilineatus TaxID=74068 RepID=UPI0023E0F0E5|nr:tetratricopeptide repeat protein 27 isoform X2 [Macrosteles quadrilineatus]
MFSFLPKQIKLGRFYDLLGIGISSLQLFVQTNWTGPPDKSKHESALPELRRAVSDAADCSETEWLDRLTAELVTDGEAISPNIHGLELLMLARAILTSDVFNNTVSTLWWRLRCLFIHQQVLEERSPNIHKQLTELLDQLMTCEAVAASSALSAQLQLEAASVWLHYGHVGKAGEAVRAASKQLGIELSLVGALGKRTKFQEKEVAQLTLSVNIDRDSENSMDASVAALGGEDGNNLPKDVKLEDDVRLSQIKFSDDSVEHYPLLTPAEQALVLASCMHKQKSQPKDKLHSEELSPYLTCLTSQPRVWALQTSALLLRSKLDSEHRRTVERALMQFQVLSDSVSSECPPASDRLGWIYACHLPPAWRIHALLAHCYISLGMVQTALGIFLSLGHWEEIVACYNFLKLRHKAAEVIKQQLEKRRTVKLLCLLGDATDDEECYREAWELSEHKSGRAQRHWALYYYNRRQYAESIPHLEKSLNINSLQEGLWFRLGYAALDQENWPLCATAYRRYCTLEPDSFEAWNNLAKAYVKTGQKARAFRALQEAVKCNYENWRVWDNLMAVSTDCGQFEEVIHCYHRILDLNEKHVDEDVLKILTNVLVEQQTGDNESASKLRKQALTLYGRLTAQVMNNSTIWQLYAQLVACGESTTESRVKVAQCLQKAYRAATQGSWERDVTSCQKVIALCVDLAKAYMQCSNQCNSSNEKVQMLSSAKLPLKSVLSKIEKEQTDLVTGELPEDLATRHKELLRFYEQIVDEIQRLQTK